MGCMRADVEFRSVLALLLLLFLALAARDAHSEVVCSSRTVSGSGDFCRFTLRDGEYVRVQISYYCPANVPDHAVVVSSAQTGKSATVTQVQRSGQLFYRGRAGEEVIRYGLLSDPHQATIEVHREKTNLGVSSPSIINRLARLNYSVSSHIPFYTSYRVVARLYGGSSNSPKETLAETTLDACYGRAECVSSVDFAIDWDRFAQSHDQLFSRIDEGRVVSESNEHDNEAKLSIPELFVRKTPNILNAYGRKRGEPDIWQPAARLLLRWFSDSPRESTSRPNWTLPTDTDIITMKWVLNSRTSHYDRARQSLNWLRGVTNDRDVLHLTGGFRRELEKKTKKYLDSLRDFRIGSTVSIGTEIPVPLTSEKIRAFHERNIYNSSLFPPVSIDPLYAALGSVRMYLVPIGDAHWQSNGDVVVTLKGTMIYIWDQFDFHDDQKGTLQAIFGSQPLGYWAEPSYIGTNPLGTRSVMNRDFRKYRELTGRGGDFAVFTKDVRKEMLRTPRRYRFKYNRAYTRMSSSGQDGGDFSFIAKHSGKCMDLDLSGGGLGNGVRILQQECSGGPSQRWSLVPAGGGYYQIINMYSNKCLDLHLGLPTNQNIVQQWDCNDHPWQLWYFPPTGDGGYRIANKATGMCLDVLNVSLSSGALVQQYTCLPNQPNQNWIVN